MTLNQEYYRRAVLNQKKGSQKVEKTCDKCGHRWRGYAAEKCPECRKK